MRILYLWTNALLINHGTRWMLAVISPAKKLNFDTDAQVDAFTQPALMSDAKKIAARAKKLSSRDLQSMMKISENLADLNAARFKAFKPPFNLANAKQAALTFAGDTYVGLQAETFSEADMSYAQDHLRILSGLYGLLRPMDLIQAYRLEMGTKFAIDRHENLYEFWGSKITDVINDATSGHKSRRLINLASNEYAKSIKTDLLEGGIVTPVFKEEKDGESRVIGLFAKRARGAMAKYMVKNRIEDEDALKGFDEDGYAYRPELSDHRTWVFTRPQPN